MRIRSQRGSGGHWSRSWRTGPVPNTERPNTWSNGGVTAFRFTQVAGWPLGRRLWGHFLWPSCLTHLPVENWPLKSFHSLFPCPLIFLLHTQPPAPQPPPPPPAPPPGLLSESYSQPLFLSKKKKEDNLNRLEHNPILEIAKITFPSPHYCPFFIKTISFFRQKNIRKILLIFGRILHDYIYIYQLRSYLSSKIPT